MCGITGWVDFARDLSREGGVVGAMSDTMACRGPDASGVWTDVRVAFGHRRLAVIDLEGGAQPMSVPGGDDAAHAVVTFSGELYNYRELRRELSSRGHRFRTASDTEVLLRGYLEWGEKCVDHFNGMFAYGLWDARSQELHLVRDRLGIKPLYYCPTPDGVVFGSEPKAILAHPGISATVGLDGLREMLATVKTPEHAVFDGMYEVRPGSALRVTRSGIVRRRYWALEAREHTDDLAATIRTVRELLADTVSRQLVADVPLCTLLSGGLDSSAVTALAAKSLKEEGRGAVRSFAVDFTAPDDVRHNTNVMHRSPDAPYAAAMARHVGADHTTLMLDTAQLMSPVTRAAVPQACDMPGAILGDGFASLYLLFRAVRDRSTVALSGEAADELFGGYAWFHDEALRRARQFPWVAAGFDFAPMLRGLLDPGLLDALDLRSYREDSYRSALAEVPRPAGESPLDRRMREITYLNITRFVPLLLDRKDRMSMATGLEVRVPFCDHRLVQYAFNIPWRLKSYDGREKSLLRAATRDLLPTAVAQRHKSAYPVTHDPAYDRALRTELAGIVRDPRSPVLPLLDQDRLPELADAHAAVGNAGADRGGWVHRGALELVSQLNTWLGTHDLRIGA
ncbi:asparagine synthase (glutamine-hydrolyzing) [Streptomyces chrestomyceticus]|uniref:asparagine synthase (glutamine-hydrolyzing) n=1 Tax=Streptomyces chrestomyceticus TaxID=68185 RepID=UPI0037A18EA9